MNLFEWILITVVTASIGAGMGLLVGYACSEPLLVAALQGAAVALLVGAGALVSTIWIHGRRARD